MSGQSLTDPGNFRDWTPFGIFVYVLPGLGALLLLFLFLPTTAVNLTVLNKTVDKFNPLFSLLGGSAFFGILGFLGTYFIDTLVATFPFLFLSRAFARMPQMPKPYGAGIVTKETRHEFRYTCDQLFFRDSSSDGYEASLRRYSQEAHRRAEEYLLQSGVDRIQSHATIAEAFRKLWGVTIIGLFGVFILGYNTFLTDYQRLLEVYSVSHTASISAWFFLVVVANYGKQKIGSLRKKATKTRKYEDPWVGWKRICMGLSYLQTVFLMSLFLSLLFRYVRLDIEYRSNVETYIGDVPYSGLIFLFIFSFVFYYQKQSHRLKKRRILMENLHHVAQSKGDIPNTDKEN
ncbi:hypothetical protein [Halorussus ruber]|uniref:hypothetical protein n=1 Tax=Halorussus ruber TaxID=1126238 RepID=UPI00109227FE|nr:hypothetical protein [Halorussus ruber]